MLLCRTKRVYNNWRISFTNIWARKIIISATILTEAISFFRPKLNIMHFAANILHPIWNISLINLRSLKCKNTISRILKKKQPKGKLSPQRSSKPWIWANSASIWHRKHAILINLPSWKGMIYSTIITADRQPQFLICKSVKVQTIQKPTQTYRSARKNPKGPRTAKIRASLKTTS